MSVVDHRFKYWFGISLTPCLSNASKSNDFSDYTATTVVLRCRKVFIDFCKEVLLNKNLNIYKITIKVY